MQLGSKQSSIVKSAKLSPQTHILEHQLLQGGHKTQYKENPNAPSDVQLQSFLGMLSFMQPYITHLSHHTASYGQLVRKITYFYMIII